MLINLTKNSQYNHKIILQTAIPRPIAWIVTEEEGRVNIAPYSLFTPLSFDPASLIVSMRMKDDGTPKDTLVNIRNTKRCTICMVEESDLDKMHFSSKEVAKDVSEAVLFDIETKIMVDGYPPVIKGVPVAYFCDLSQEITLHEDNTVPLILNIKEVFVDDSSIEDRDSLKISFNPIAHVGADYALLGESIKAPSIP